MPELWQTRRNSLRCTFQPTSWRKREIPQVPRFPHRSIMFSVSFQSRSGLPDEQGRTYRALGRSTPQDHRLAVWERFCWYQIDAFGWLWMPMNALGTQYVDVYSSHVVHLVRQPTLWQPSPLIVYLAVNCLDGKPSVNTLTSKPPD